MEIHQAGGGIGFTVRHTREASEEQLLELLLARLRRMLVSGTTLVEAKSGSALFLCRSKEDRYLMRISVRIRTGPGK
jgi:imidazolonepropionase